ncbi:uncharacterized protein [Eleutherodactylus coqui]|uniref:uncharacterized protein n=1 Tax=Eleutherodactylus coqui TaxID=57060 RepID=UPI0034626473
MYPEEMSSIVNHLPLGIPNEQLIAQPTVSAVGPDIIIGDTSRSAKAVLIPIESMDTRRRELGKTTFIAGGHFIDRHRADLIHRITNVDPVVNELYRKDLLTGGERDNIMRPRHPEEKMRRLYVIIKHRYDRKMEEVYHSLYKHNPRVIDDLNIQEDESQLEKAGGHFIDRHKEDLIHGITYVDRVIDDLYRNDLLTVEKRDYIMRPGEPEEKMRRLYESIRGRDKEEVYHSFYDYNSRVIIDLKMREDESQLEEAGGHFIDRHREDLIHRITDVDPVVDDLFHKRLLRMGHWHYIRKPREPEEKMRRLYEIIREQDYRDKEEVYNSFYKYNPYIIEMQEDEPQLEEGLGVTFIDRHRSDLVIRITDVDPVLRDLRDQKLLTQEQYDDVVKKPTNWKKMEELCDVISHWEDAGKYKAYITLRRLNKHLITDLEVKDRMWREVKLPKVRAGGHFIDRHREDLIHRITNVDPVVDDLFRKRRLTVEERDNIMRRGEPEEKMRRLYEIIRDRDYWDKEEVYRTFYKHNPRVINDLKMREDEPQLEEAKSQESETSMMGNTGVKEDDLSCKLCDQSQGSGKVITPTLIHSTYRLSMTSPGLFRCSESGIQFQVTQPVTIEYEVDSWCNYTEILQNLHSGYEIIGPLFNIRSTLEPNVVTAVYLPHCLCLGGFKGAKSLIKCFHYKDDNLVLESPSRIDAMYAVLENPTFSGIGVILYPLTLLKEGIINLIPCHGMVLLFYNTITRDDLTYKYKLHLYLLPNIRTVEKEVEREEARHSCRRIYKPPQTESVYFKKKYRINGPQTAHVIPKTLLFESDRLCKLYSYIEIKIIGEKNTEVNVSVHPEAKDITVWEAMVSAEEMIDVPSEMSKSTIQPGGLQHLPEENDHFVDKHRAYLIRKISDIAPVLDTLEELHLLTHEQCETVSHQKTNPEKMRKLYDYMKGWGNDDKDKVYQALGEHNQPTIEHLENLCRSALT